MKKTNLLATILSALGGLLFSLPWFFLYINNFHYFHYFSVLIPLGFYIFYELFKGKYYLNIIRIIGFESLLLMILINFLLIPVYAMKTNNIEMRFDNYFFLYSFPKFRESLIKNLIMGAIFILLGTLMIYIFQKKTSKKIKK